MTDLEIDHTETLVPGGAFLRRAPHARPPALSSAGDYSLATDWKIVWGPQQSGLTYCWCDGLPMSPPPNLARSMQFGLKRVLDILLCCLGLVLVGPLLLFVAIAIKTTSEGPLFFRQDRVGRDGKIFRIYKFRTMYTDRGDSTGVSQTVRDDCRITPIGKFLRAKSIDELPQLLNVLLGDMSLVGPRPHVPGMLAAGVTYETLVPYYAMRGAVKPGLTGWAQVNGYRGPTNEAAAAVGRVDHDLAYIQNFSMMLDIKIIILTAWRELVQGTGF